MTLAGRLAADVLLDRATALIAGSIPGEGFLVFSYDAITGAAINATELGLVTTVDGTATELSTRIVICAVTRVPGHRSSSSFGMVARTIAMPVVVSTAFSIMVTTPFARLVSPGTMISTLAVSAASAWRMSGRFFCGIVKVT